jgi:1,2-diacylglycerol 3-beta-glucosyltransferase
MIRELGNSVEAGGIHISFEKILLSTVILAIGLVVLLMEKFIPYQSAGVIVFCFILAYSTLISLASIHRRRKIIREGGDLTLDASYHPSVSIVVPAHNEALVIRDTVKNILDMEYDNFDLWVFDDRSQDTTPEVLHELEKSLKDQRLHIIVRDPDAMPGKSAVLNDALASTRGEIIVVFDADGRVNPDFLNKTLPYLADSGVGAAQVRKVIINADTNVLTRCQGHEYLLDAHFQSGRDAIRGAVELRGNGQLVKRAALESVNGWNEETITDDLDLSTKLHLAGWDIRFVRDVQVFEEGIIHFKPLLKQRRRWAEGSLKRYLEHAVDVVMSPRTARRTTFDMLAYFMEFLLPVWLVSDSVLQVLNLFLKLWPSHLMSSLVMLPIVSLFFASGLYAAIRYYERASVLNSCRWAIETGIFLFTIWCPVVMWIIAKVLFTKDEGPLNWGKTEHLGTRPDVIKRSRLERFKSLIQRAGS